MTHADKMIAFFSVGIASKTKGFWECDECYAPVGQAVVIDGEAYFTCPDGHENKQ